jgi:glycosyltransferase involved in cell wall biosynthesis
VDLSDCDYVTCMVSSTNPLGFRTAREYTDCRREPTRGRIALVSLRFKPAFVSHLAAFGKACQELGFEVEFVVDPEYARSPDLAAIARVTVYSDSMADNSYTHAVFANVSTANRDFARGLKPCGAKILYVYHEPWGSSLDFFRGEGIRGGVTGALAHRVSVQMLKLADAVILPSKYAARVYGQGDIRYNPNAFYLPLLFDDEADGMRLKETGRRQYFSYIGTICQAHGFAEYVDFMRESLVRKWNLNFMIASRVRLPAYVLMDNVISRNLDKVEILCGRPLQNGEINRCYSESFCVWNMYRRSTQSGVLPKAFMFGAPVLANRIGSFPEFIQDGFNGKFASARDHKAVLSALESIRENIGHYTVNCRKTFLETFFYRANLPELARLLTK